MSDSDSIIDLTDSPSKTNIGTARGGSPSATPPSAMPPGSTMLAGKTFYITGTWATMLANQAKELCMVNGGHVQVTPSPKVDYVVVGARGTRQDVSPFIKAGAQKISEKQFLNMLLPGDEESTSSAGQKRVLPEPESEPTKSKKRVKKSDAGLNQERQYKRVQWFLCDGEIQLKGKKMEAFDCGGSVYTATRGKSVTDLLGRFEDFLEECDGEYHSHL